MKLELTVSVFGNSYHLLLIPEAEALEIVSEIGKRVILQAEGKPPLHCAIQKNKTIGYFITLGKSTKDKLKIEAGDILQITFLPDTSKYQLDLCEEFQAVLETDLDGEACFDKLKPGMQRGIIHYVNSAKRSDTRIERSLKIIGKIKMGMTDRKELFR